MIESHDKTSAEHAREQSFAKPCSSKATSVIRLASQKPIKSTSPIENGLRITPKTSYNRPPKKLIVKLKKPFVPVIEEEANLHAPESLTDPIDSNKVKIERTNRNDAVTVNNLFEVVNKNENEFILECCEDVPFSPLRQSHTPLPVNPQLDQILTLADDDAIIIEDCVNELDANVSKEKLNENSGNQCSEDSKLVIFTISSADGDDLQDEAIENVSEPNESSAFSSTAKQTNQSDYSVETASTSSEPTNLSQSNFLNSAAGTSRMDYGISTFLGYNEQHEGEYFYSGVRLSPVPFINEPNAWNQRFSPQYAPFEVDKQSSYMDLDGCKNTLSGERAPSTDSLNIRTDEKMPAKGEISEQESNGDIDGSWSHQVHFKFKISF